MSLTKLMSPPNLNVWLPVVMVTVSANCQRRSSGNAARSRNSGMPNEKPFWMKVCGERPPRSVGRFARQRRLAELRFVVASPLEAELVEQGRRQR